MASLEISRDGHVETWTLNLPELRNPITGEDTLEAFLANLERIDADPDVRCVILTGAGTAFSSGGDLRAMRDASGMFGGTPFEQRQGYRQGIQRLPLAMEACEVPFIAAVNGPAVGAGCDLTVMCDIRIAGESAGFAESFVKVGLIPGDGGSWLMTQAIGSARATEMALTGRMIDADTAAAWGLVSQVVPDAELLPTARELAAQIAANPPQAVRMTKKLMRRAREQDLSQILELSGTLQALAHQTEDHKESVAAMLEKRRPDITGR